MRPKALKEKQVRQPRKIQVAKKRVKKALRNLLQAPIGKRKATIQKSR